MIEKDVPQNTDATKTTPARSDGLGLLLGAFAVVVFVLLPVIWVAYAHYLEPYRSNAESAPADPSPSQSETPKERKARLNGTEFYNDETPSSKLVKQYTDALAKSVQDKDTTACQAGLKQYRSKIEDMPKAVLIDIDENYSTAGWTIPINDDLMTADHMRYACQQASRVDFMSELVLSHGGLQALETLDSEYVTNLKDGPKVCFDILSIDYRSLVKHSTTPADRVVLSLTALALPQDLTDEQFATLCEYALPKNN